MITLPKEYNGKMYLLYLISGKCLFLADNDYSRNDKDWVRVKEVDVHVDLEGISVNELTAEAISGLEDKKKEIYAEASRKAGHIEEQIQQLKAIGFIPERGDEDENSF